MALRILLVEDHLMVLQGLRELLEREGFDVVGEASDGYQAIRLAQDLRPDLVILDIALPLMNGLDAAREILKVSPGTKTMLLTMHTEDQYVLEALRANIRGYVLKTQVVEDLIQAIREVAQGSIYLSPGVSRTVVEAYLSKSELPADPLTSRERQILQLVAERKSTKEIAAFLGVSMKTVESHRARIMEKLNIHEIAGLVRYAIRRGLIEP